MKDCSYLLECLHELISRNVITDNAYASRYKGFNAELDFLGLHDRVKKGSTLYTGGYFLPRIRGHATLKEPIYFTVCSEDPVAYIPIYQAIARLQCQRLFYIRFDDSADITDWPTEDVMGVDVQLPVPVFEVYEFCADSHLFKLSNFQALLSLYTISSSPAKSGFSRDSEKYKQLLSRYSYPNLLQLYVSRLVFDGYIGFRRERGAPGDIDAISEKNGTLTFLEIKEKDISKREPKGFGMDLNRIDSLADIMDKTQLNYLYVVRQIDNQEDRNLLAWRYISMRDFIESVGSKVINGGYGMGFSDSENPTKICPCEFFKDIKDV